MAISATKKVNEPTRDDCYNQGHLRHFAYGDYHGAADWYLKAAKQEHPDAQHFLGMLYESGLGVDHCSEKAKYWFKRSAKNGSMESILALIDICIAEAKIEQHTEPLVNALPWLVMAAKRRHQKSHRRIKAIRAKLRDNPDLINQEGHALLMTVNPNEAIVKVDEPAIPAVRPALLAGLLIGIITIIVMQQPPKVNPQQTEHKLSFSEALKVVEPIIPSHQGKAEPNNDKSNKKRLIIEDKHGCLSTHPGVVA